MSYYYAKKLNLPFDEAVSRLRQLLQAEGFGVVTEMDVRQKFKEKLGIDFKPYLILGACNPQFAHKALLVEDKLGTMLPCNFMIQSLNDELIEVAAINPEDAMKSIGNDRLSVYAAEVGSVLKRIIDKL